MIRWPFDLMKEIHFQNRSVSCVGDITKNVGVCTMICIIFKLFDVILSQWQLALTRIITQTPKGPFILSVSDDLSVSRLR